jgi:hypothetical protein
MHFSDSDLNISHSFVRVCLDLTMMVYIHFIVGDEVLLPVCQIQSSTPFLVAFLSSHFRFSIDFFSWSVPVHEGLVAQLFYFQRSPLSRCRSIFLFDDAVLFTFLIFSFLLLDLAVFL